jgi:hypothetical protein
LGDLNDEPTLEDALKGPEASKWDAGVREELDSLKKMGVYELIPRSEVPKEQRVLKDRFILRHKRDETGDPVRWMARLVIKGFEQVFGQYYTETTSPTARMGSFRILLHIAAVNNWPVHQVDVKMAYLYGTLPPGETQYMEQLPRYEEEWMEDWIWRLIKGLYGIRQSGRLWNKVMHTAMMAWGSEQLLSEHCIYYRRIEDNIIIAAIHIDDFMAIGTSVTELDRFKQQMCKKWKISDLGEAKFCIGIGIERDWTQRPVKLSQTALIDHIVNIFGQTDVDPYAMPMEEGLILRRPPPDSVAMEEESKLPYRSLIDMLSYVAHGT